jgi:hypothetical protein
MWVSGRMQSRVKRRGRLTRCKHILAERLPAEGVGRTVEQVPDYHVLVHDDARRQLDRLLHEGAHEGVLELVGRVVVVLLARPVVARDLGGLLPEGDEPLDLRR